MSSETIPTPNESVENKSNGKANLLTISNLDRCSSEKTFYLNKSDQEVIKNERSKSLTFIDQPRARMNEKFDQIELRTGINLRRKIKHKKDSSSPETESASTIDDISILSLGSEDRIRAYSAAEVKEQAGIRLEIELKKTQLDLKLKDEEIAKLSRIRKEVESELEDLTASLFEEANKMVHDANVRRVKAEKEFKEAKMKIDVLQAEVSALKTLLLTSTHPRANTQSEKNRNGIGIKGIHTKVMNSLSPTKKIIANKSNISLPHHYEISNKSHLSDSSQPIVGEVDPEMYEEFSVWKKNPTLSRQSPFMQRIYNEEIFPTFNFNNKILSEFVINAIEDNSIIVEAVSEKTPFPKKCALLDIARVCKYRMNLKNEWYNISELCRNRIIAVCELFCYLRYIQRGLVKSGFHVIYWEIMKRRKNIVLTRLGYPCY